MSIDGIALLYLIERNAMIGIAYTAPMAAGWKFKPNNKGLVSGGILAGFGSGMLVLLVVINP